VRGRSFDFGFSSDFSSPTILTDERKIRTGLGLGGRIVHHAFGGTQVGGPRPVRVSVAGSGLAGSGFFVWLASSRAASFPGAGFAFSAGLFQPVWFQSGLFSAGLVFGGFFPLSASFSSFSAWLRRLAVSSRSGFRSRSGFAVGLRRRGFRQRAFFFRPLSRVAAVSWATHAFGNWANAVTKQKTTRPTAKDGRSPSERNEEFAKIIEISFMGSSEGTG